MTAPSQYAVVSLPLRTFEYSDQDGALAALRATVGPDNGSVQAFPIPEFKIGTLDALVQQADDLAKLGTGCEGVVARVAESLRAILDNDDEKVAQQKIVNDNNYLQSFAWNRVRYRVDRPLVEIIDTLQKELVNIDNDIKAKFSQYNAVKANLAALQRKQTGNLATKSLTPIVNPALLVQDSEYLESHLIVVPSGAKREFLHEYETLAPMVVPRSAVEVAEDDEFALFAVTTFKKHSTEFLQKCREQKWTPRQYKYTQGGREEEQRELDRVAKEERKVWGEALWLARTSWSESVMVWMHVLTLRVFVETVLRYGLPLEFVSALIKSSPRTAKKVKTALDGAYSYLGGNAFGRDKKGKITKDDAALTSEMAAAGVGFGEGNEYTAFVYYEFAFP